MKFLFEDELPGQVDIFTVQKEIDGEELYNKIEDKDNIESWFNILVPQSGKADTIAGELVRAMMRILYRDYNDGDRFFSGYGVETCGGSAQFLIENTDDRISDHLIQIAEDDLNSQDYSDAINEVAFDLINYLKNHKELLSEPNTQDSRDWELEEEFVPKYDFECMLPDNLIELIDSGKYSEEDLEGEIYYWESYGDQIGRVADNISVQGNSLYIEGLTEDIYNELNRHMYRWLEDFANDLDAELVDEEYLDEGLENAKYGIIELAKFKKGNFRNFRPVDTLENARWQKDSLERADKKRFVIFTIDDKQLVEESLHNDEIEQHKKIAKEIGLKTLGDLKSFKDHQGSAELDALKDYKKELDLDEALGLKEGYASWLCKYWPDDEDDKAQLDRKLKHLNLKKELVDKDAVIKGDKENIQKFMTWLGLTDNRFSEIKEESLKEDTIKQNGKWVNKGKEGTHGTFKTKKAADAQRKAMFANGFKEDLDESLNKSDILDEVEKWAKDDFEQGLTLDPNDYNEFKHLLIDNYPELEKESDESFRNWFDYYFDTVNDLRSGDYFDVEHAEEFIERNPHGYYNSENDYGNPDDWDDEDNDEYLDEALENAITEEDINKILDTLEWDRGNGTVELDDVVGDKLKFYIDGDHGHTHAHFRRLLTDEANKLGYDVKLLSDKEIGHSHTDWYKSIETFKVTRLKQNNLSLDEINKKLEELGKASRNTYDEYAKSDYDPVIYNKLMKINKEYEKLRSYKLYLENNLQENLKEDDEADYSNREDIISDKDIEELDKDIDDLKAFADKVMKENIKPLNINNTNEEVTPIYENSNIVMEDIDDEVIVDYVNENITEKAGE